MCCAVLDTCDAVDYHKISPLYFSYLSGVLASELSFCIPKMYHIKTRT